MFLTVISLCVVAALASCPEYMTLVEVANGTQAYQVCVDMYEAYVVEVMKDGTEKLWPFNYPVDNVTVKAMVAPNVLPQAYMSGDTAAQACWNSNKRLCSLNEWLAACQGPQNFTYPYGNNYEPGFCNEGRAENPVNELFGPNATFNATEMNDPRLDKFADTVTETGEFSKCVSVYQIYDLHGNLDEWIDHINEPSGHGTFKGGFFVDAKINGPGCLYRTVAHVTSWHDYSLGFRCCADIS